jgi:hypothetical protein
MSAQLTLQAPLELPPADLTAYLERLWSGDLAGSTGDSYANGGLHGGSSTGTSG